MAVGAFLGALLPLLLLLLIHIACVAALLARGGFAAPRALAGARGFGGRGGGFAHGVREASAGARGFGGRGGGLRMVSAMSQQIKEMRASVANSDPRAALVMDALRGKNLNDDDRQGEGIDMKLVEMRASAGTEDVLPFTYQPDKLDDYFSQRPGAVVQRVYQVLSTSSSFLFKVLIDFLTGNTADMEVRRAAELRNTIISLGPFFIKLGQALSIRPDILSPRAMVELQQLCDKVPCYSSTLAFETIKAELGKPVSELFSEITPEPVAAASLGQVYKATLAATGEQVAVKVQRPFVLETVSLDLYLVRKIGLLLRSFPQFSSRLDIVSILDEFAGNFYQELDYNLECRNGVEMAEDMRVLPMVLIPKNYPEYTSRRVHTAQWVDGEKLSQSSAGDVGSLVNLGVITYLTQLLDTGFFHADPHPGNMIRSNDGQLIILDFGLMTRITDDQKYGMIESIAHLIHRDYDLIGQDFINLDFIPKGTDTKPIIPALARVFDAALAGGGAKSINFQELAADLAEITFSFPFRIPPYFALIIRAISVLEGIALVGNPEFALIDEAYPFISKRLLTSQHPRLQAAFRYMIYGKSNSLDIDRLIDLLQAFEKFVQVKDYGDGSAYKKEGVRGGMFVGKAGSAKGTRSLQLSASSQQQQQQQPQPQAQAQAQTQADGLAREALKFFFSPEGLLFRNMVLDETCTAIDGLSRDAVRELVFQLGFDGAQIPAVFRALAPKLTAEDKKVVAGIRRLSAFLLNGSDGASGAQLDMNVLLSSSLRPENRQKLQQLVPVLREFAPSIRDFGQSVLRRLVDKASTRALQGVSQAVFG